MDAAATGDFLDVFEGVVQGGAPPAARFDPSGAWTHQYRIFTLIFGRKGPMPNQPDGGVLTLRRTPQAAGGSILDVKLEKTSRYDGDHLLTTSIASAGDALATPLRWDSRFVAAPPSRPLAMSREIRETATLQNRTLDIEAGAARKRVELTGNFTTQWSLFDAVQRLPRQQGDALRFTLLDTGGVSKPNQVLAFYRTADLTGRWNSAPPIRVHGFIQIGTGIAPQVYWVDDRGELLFMISGLDVYILQSFVRPTVGTGA
jgi:hypothetical protein